MPQPRRLPPDQEPFIAHCLELLGSLGPARAIRMFGAVGLYIGEHFVAIAEQEQLFLKAGAAQRAAFEAAGCEPFRYTKADGEVMVMSYWRAPEEAMESPAAMRDWAARALAAAREKPVARARRARA